MNRLCSLLLPLTALIINGCAPAYNAQLVKLAAPALKNTPTGLVLDNDTLTLTFDFYQDRGLMRITMVNKLNVPLYVDWKQSALIMGQNKIDYWYDVADVSLDGLADGGINPRYSNYYWLNLSGTIAREDRIEFMPPRTQIVKQRFMIVPKPTSLRLEGQFAVVEQRPTSEGRQKPFPAHQYTFTPDQSPLRFRNYLTLSTDRDFKTQFHLDTDFYATEVVVMSREQLQGGFGGNRPQPDGYGHPFQAPNAFYMTWNALAN
jgi:hypothetical protein